MQITKEQFNNLFIVAATRAITHFSGIENELGTEYGIQEKQYNGNDLKFLGFGIPPDNLSVKENEYINAINRFLGLGSANENDAEIKIHFKFANHEIRVSEGENLAEGNLFGIKVTENGIKFIIHGKERHIDDNVEFLNEINTSLGVNREIEKLRINLTQNCGCMNPNYIPADIDYEKAAKTVIKKAKIKINQELIVNDQDSKLQSKSGADMKTPLNCILYGPPGTGKTHNSLIAALALTANYLKQYDEPGFSYAIEAWKCLLDSENPPHDEHKRKAMEDSYQKLVISGNIVFTTFHQSYGYEEFISGMRASTQKVDRELPSDGISPADIKSESHIVYEIKSGVFKELCDKACKNQDQAYVIIIDEINRGNISKIFGELITLIEESKRWDFTTAKEHLNQVILPCREPEWPPFKISNNLFIIGTMNTADRSLALLDIALRRRFTFIEMSPDPKLLSDIDIEGINIARLLENLNNRIEILLDRDHTIGHAFFMDLKNDKYKNMATLANIFRHNIIPLLEEYFFEDWENIRRVLGDTENKPAEFQFIKSDEKAYEVWMGERNKSPRMTYVRQHSALMQPKAYLTLAENKPKSEQSQS